MPALQPGSTAYRAKVKQVMKKAKSSSGSGSYKVGGKSYTLAQMLANPRLRSTLPDSKLPANLLAMRKEIQRKKKPAGPGSSLTTGKVEEMLRTQFAPQQSVLDTRQREIPAWFQGFRDRLGALSADQAARQSASSAAIQQFQANAAANSGAANAQNNQQTAQANSVVGAQGGDPQAAARQQAAENVRQTGIGGFGALSQVLGQNQQNFLQGAQGVATGMEGNARSDLTKMYADLAAKKQAGFQDILSQEQKSKLEAAAFGLKSSDIAADNARQDATANSTIEKNKASTQKTQAELAYFRQHGRWPSSSTGSKGGTNGKDVFGNTRKQRDANKYAWTKLVRISRARVEGAKDAETLARRLLIAAKEYGINIPPGYADIAAERALNGGKLSDAARKRLLRDGIVKP